jgi:hypothetical protein
LRRARLAQPGSHQSGVIGSLGQSGASDAGDLVAISVAAEATDSNALRRVPGALRSPP